MKGLMPGALPRNLTPVRLPAASVGSATSPTGRTCELVWRVASPNFGQRQRRIEFSHGLQDFRKIFRLDSYPACMVKTIGGRVKGDFLAFRRVLRQVYPQPCHLLQEAVLVVGRAYSSKSSYGRPAFPLLILQGQQTSFYIRTPYPIPQRSLQRQRHYPYIWLLSSCNS